jgi:hypothetical protein
MTWKRRRSNHPTPARLAGFFIAMKPLDYIRARIKEDGDCWIWQLGCTSNGTPTMHPTGEKQQATRRWLAIKLGKRIPHNHVATTKCGNPRCVCPDHLLIASRSTLAKATDARTGYTRAPQRRKRISDDKRARFAKLDIEKVQAIRDAPTSRHAAAEHGVSKATAARIRAHELWKDYSSPFQGLGAR